MWLSLLLNRYVLGSVAIAGVVFSIWYSLNQWHYKPISDRDKTIQSLRQTIKAKDITIENIGTQLQQLMEQNKVTGFEEYFKGKADANFTDSNTSDLVF